METRELAFYFHDNSPGASGFHRNFRLCLALCCDWRLKSTLAREKTWKSIAWKLLIAMKCNNVFWRIWFCTACLKVIWIYMTYKLHTDLIRCMKHGLKNKETASLIYIHGEVLDQQAFQWILERRKDHSLLDLRPWFRYFNGELGLELWLDLQCHGIQRYSSAHPVLPDRGQALCNVEV